MVRILQQFEVLSILSVGSRWLPQKSKWTAWELGNPNDAMNRGQLNAWSDHCGNVLLICTAHIGKICRKFLPDVHIPEKKNMHNLTLCKNHFIQHVVVFMYVCNTYYCSYIAKPHTRWHEQMCCSTVIMKSCS